MNEISTREQALERLSYILAIAPQKLRAIPEEEFSLKINPGKWSKKEILGHLIDSAANNLQRFVRGQFEEMPEIRYDQNNWNKHSFHQEIKADLIITIWTAQNQQILEIIRRIPSDSLSRELKSGADFLTLEFLIADYVVHLEHHLRQIIEY